MVHKKEEGTYHRIEKLMKEMPGLLSPRKSLLFLLTPEYSGINKEQRIPDRSKTAHGKPSVKCFLTIHVRLFVILWTIARKASFVHHQLLGLAQAHVYGVSDTIQISHPLSPTSPPAFSLSQHQGLFQWVSSSHQVDEVLELQLQHQSFEWIFRTDFL